MKKFIMTSSAILTLTIASQAAFADSSKQISKEDLAAIQQDYILEYNAHAQPRRSALFAHILDSLATAPTIAKADAGTGELLKDLDEAISASVTL